MPLKTMPLKKNEIDKKKYKKKVCGKFPADLFLYKKPHRFTGCGSSHNILRIMLFPLERNVACICYGFTSKHCFKCNI